MNINASWDAPHSFRSIHRMKNVASFSIASEVEEFPDNAVSD